MCLHATKLIMAVSVLAVSSIPSMRTQDDSLEFGCFQNNTFVIVLSIGPGMSSSQTIAYRLREMLSEENDPCSRIRCDCHDGRDNCCYDGDTNRCDCDFEDAHCCNDSAESCCDNSDDNCCGDDYCHCGPERTDCAKVSLRRFKERFDSEFQNPEKLRRLCRLHRWCTGLSSCNKNHMSYSISCDVQMICPPPTTEVPNRNKTSTASASITTTQRTSASDFVESTTNPGTQNTLSSSSYTTNHKASDETSPEVDSGGSTDFQISEGMSGNDVTSAAVGTTVAVLAVIAGVCLFVWWWRRRRADKRAKTQSTLFASDFSSLRSPKQSGISNDGGEEGVSRSKESGASPKNRKSEHVYTHIDSVTNLRSTSELQAGAESMYSELDDVTGRKLPTAPALNDNYSLAHNPDQPQPMQGTTTSASVYSLAHNPEAEAANTPKYFILEEEGKGSSGDDQSAGGQYFILEEGAADAENEGKKLMAPQGAVTMHGAHEYSSLASTGRAENRNDPGAEYTPLSQTSTDKQGAQSANGEGLKKDGQYFILEEGTAEDGEDKGNGGQYFILEEDAATENKSGQQGGQYFILEEGAAAMDDSQDDTAERDYSHLNPADMGDNSSDRNEYTPLGFVAEDPAEKPATTTNEYFELESDYSLQKTV